MIIAAFLCQIKEMLSSYTFLCINTTILCFNQVNTDYNIVTPRLSAALTLRVKLAGAALKKTDGETEVGQNEGTADIAEHK